MEKFWNFVLNHKWAIITILAGILFAILIFSIGFWRTLLLGIIIAICFYIGNSIDKSHKSRGQFRNDD